MRRVNRVSIAAALLLIVACGDDDAPPGPSTVPLSSLVPAGPPVGEAVLPDLVPEPPARLNMEGRNGTWSIRFNSVIVNVGEGDFALEARREGDVWTVTQAISHSGGGAERVPSEAVLVWGGDGHGHWHVERVAAYKLEPLFDRTAVEPGPLAREDTKIGFCFFDYGQELNRGPAAARFSAGGCGGEESTELVMGLSPGWGDTYKDTLPGQSIDVTDLADGAYRLWAEADERAWFVETTRDNNRTWIDFELETRDGGIRVATITATGPTPT